MHTPPEDEPSEFSDEPSELEESLREFRTSFKPEENESLSHFFSDGGQEEIENVLQKVEKIDDAQDPSEIEQILQEAETVLEQHINDTPHLLLALGAIKLKLGKPDESVDLLRAYSREQPDDHHGHITLAKALIECEHYEDAETTLHRCIELEPLPIAHYFLGVSLLNQDKSLEAIESFKEYLSYEPDDFDAIYAIGQAQVQLGERTQALATFERTRALANDDPRLLLRVGAAFHIIAELKEAEDIFRFAISKGCDIVGKLMLAETQFINEKFTQAEQNALDYCNERPDDPDGFYLLGLAQFKKRSYLLAEGAFRRSTALNPTPPSFHFLALSQIAQRKFPQAGRTLREYADQEENRMLKYVAEYLEREDLPKAEHCLERCLQEDSMNTKYWTYLANIRKAQDKELETIKERLSGSGVDDSDILLVL